MDRRPEISGVFSGRYFGTAGLFGADKISFMIMNNSGVCAGRENLMEKQFAQWMEEECSQIGVTLSEKQMEQFFQYL